MKSNLTHWQHLQEEDYFEKHPCYKGLVDMGDNECNIVEWFTSFRPAMNVVVIGCGYGRESVHIARRVGRVYGIDVSTKILDKAARYVAEHHVSNFTPVLAESFATAIPTGVDLVFSIVVFQHLTRDLAANYLNVLGGKLSPDGRMIIQFVEDFAADPNADAELKDYEPSVSYNIRQVVETIQPFGLRLEAARSLMATPSCIWHWMCLARDDVTASHA